MSDSAARAGRDRWQRILNGIALLLIAAGVVTYGVALSRMERIRDGELVIGPAAGPPVSRNLDQYWNTKDLADAALWITGLGAAMAVGAAVRHARRTKRLAHGQENHS